MKIINVKTSVIMNNASLYQEPFNYLYVGDRRCGNSTRQVDEMVQLLFKGYAIKVTDHHGELRSDKRLLDILVKRLITEHTCDIYISKEDNIVYITQ